MAAKKTSYTVTLYEVHSIDYNVTARSPEEALAKARDGKGLGDNLPEYSHQLDSFKVENDDGDIVLEHGP